ncbi:HNH endonuclease [Burkholderia phage BcepSauron]|uniref:HNH endonuclease n=1 Tax=Burkholderia phage BcepSauron TaxID=2530033 RepID=A0A482MLE9_9CAUD|nr:HNH endonuclease [Burkholderia phage BcepSauron]QBQ74604.1 HNH endonuclease [Burkholderia phage BcepSauron]
MLEKSKPERWKAISGFPDYMVSTHGRVKSLARAVTFERAGRSVTRTAPEKILKQQDHTQVYKSVSLYRGGHQHLMLVHRLVADGFVKNPQNLPVAMHGDDNKHNNHYKNLTWGTHKKNVQDAHASGLANTARGSQAAKAVVNEAQVLEIVRLLNSGVTQKEAASMYGLSRSSVSHIKLGLSWSHITGIGRS